MGLVEVAELERKGGEVQVGPQQAVCRFVEAVALDDTLGLIPTYSRNRR